MLTDGGDLLEQLVARPVGHLVLIYFIVAVPATTSERLYNTGRAASRRHPMRKSPQHHVHQMRPWLARARGGTGNNLLHMMARGWLVGGTCGTWVARAPARRRRRRRRGRRTLRSAAPHRPPSYRRRSAAPRPPCRRPSPPGTPAPAAGPDPRGALLAKGDTCSRTAAISSAFVAGGPHACETSVWEAWCWYSGAMNMS